MKRVAVALATAAAHAVVGALMVAGGGGSGPGGAGAPQRPLQVRLLPADDAPTADADLPVPMLALPPAATPPDPPELPDLPGAAPAAPDPRYAHYVPDAALERSALPRSQPDVDLLRGTPMSGLPIRLRLYIDEHGQVQRIDTLHARDEDRLAVERLKEMLQRTAFVPGRLAGREVASWQDLEFRTDEL